MLTFGCSFYSKVIVANSVNQASTDPSVNHAPVRPPTPLTISPTRAPSIRPHPTSYANVEKVTLASGARNAPMVTMVTQRNQEVAVNRVPVVVISILRLQVSYFV